jgi:hypothetical protein
MGSLLHCLLDGPSQIQLREATFIPLSVSKNGQDQTATPGSDPEHWAAWLAKDQAGDVGAVGRHWSPTRGIPHQRLNAPEIGTLEAGMGEVNRPVDYRDAHTWVAKSVPLEGLNPGQRGADIHGAVSISFIQVLGA